MRHTTARNWANGFAVLQSMEIELNIAFNRLKAIQELGRQYKHSEFALKEIRPREKLCKREWWKASEAYRNAKRWCLGEV